MNLQDIEKEHKKVYKRNPQYPEKEHAKLTIEIVIKEMQKIFEEGEDDYIRDRIKELQKQIV